jgi:hypothetical protein
MAMALAVLGLSACWIGCGGGGDYSSPKATFETARGALKAHNREAFLACLDENSRKGMSEIMKAMDEIAKTSPEMKKEMEGKDLMTAASEEFNKPKTEVGAEKVTGDTATLEVTSDGKKETLNFVKEPAGWKLLPPGKKMTPEDVKMAVEMIKSMAKMAAPKK